MKLAEALIIRKDFQKQIAMLKNRIVRNAKVQEGEKVAEDPNELLKELEGVIIELELLINRINKTNAITKVKTEETIAELITRRELLGKQNQILRELSDEATIKCNRYSRSEVKFFSTVKVSEIQKKIDRISKEYREIDTKLQEANWTVDLV